MANITLGTKMAHGSIAHQAAETQKVGLGVARYAPMGKCLVAALNRVMDAYSTRVAESLPSRQTPKLDFEQGSLWLR